MKAPALDSLEEHGLKRENEANIIEREREIKDRQKPASFDDSDESEAEEDDKFLINNKNVSFDYLRHPVRFEREARQHIKKKENCIELISPFFKGTIKIPPNAHVGSYGDRFEELKILEQQMLEMSTIPDFGYEKDDLIFRESETNDPMQSWRVFGSFLESSNRFQILMNHIKLTKMRER